MLSIVLPHESVAPGEGRYISLCVTLVNQADFDKCPTMTNVNSPSGAVALAKSLRLQHMDYEESKKFGVAIVEVVKGIRGTLEEI
jgi:hypothetical protein